MSKTYIIEDISNLVYRGLHTFKMGYFSKNTISKEEEFNQKIIEIFKSHLPKLPTTIELKEEFPNNPEFVESGLFIGSIFKMLNSNKNKFKVENETHLFTLDSTSWRKEFLANQEPLIPEIEGMDKIEVEDGGYKAGRDKSSLETVLHTIELITKIQIETYPELITNIFKKDRYEADDFFALIKEQIIKDNPDNNIILLTSDADMDQLANASEINETSKGVIVKYNPNKKKFSETVGAESLLEKVFIGDKSDNISSIIPTIFYKEENLALRVMGEVGLKKEIKKIKPITFENLEEKSKELIKFFADKYYKKILKKTKDDDLIELTLVQLEEMMTNILNHNLQMIDLRNIPEDLVQMFNVSWEKKDFFLNGEETLNKTKKDNDEESKEDLLKRKVVDIENEILKYQNSQHISSEEYNELEKERDILLRKLNGENIPEKIEEGIINNTKHRIAIIGSRDCEHFGMIQKTFLEYIDKQGFSYGDIVIVSGGAKGADKMGEELAQLYKIETDIYLPDWDKHGKAAGFIRNKDIVDNSDIIMAFTNGSNGTQNSIDYANKTEKPVIEKNFKKSYQKIDVRTIKFYTEDLVSKNSSTIFVFGDNVQKVGKKGQAVIRDCPNSFGVPTKIKPAMTIDSFFSDKEEEIELIKNSLRELYNIVRPNKNGRGKQVVFPLDGIGTGLAKLAENSPKLLEEINNIINEFFYGEDINKLEYKGKIKKEQPKVKEPQSPPPKGVFD